MSSIKSSSVSNTMSHQRQALDLLAFPFEIRESVLKMYFRRTYVPLKSTFLAWRQRKDNYQDDYFDCLSWQFAIMETSKQLQKEATDAFYASATFRFPHEAVMQGMLPSPTAFHHIARVELEMTLSIGSKWDHISYSFRRLMDFLNCVASPRSCTVEIEAPWHWCSPSCLHLGDSLSPVLETMGPLRRFPTVELKRHSPLSLQEFYLGWSPEIAECVDRRELVLNPSTVNDVMQPLVRVLFGEWETLDDPPMIAGVQVVKRKALLHTKASAETGLDDYYLSDLDFF